MHCLNAPPKQSGPSRAATRSSTGSRHKARLRFSVQTLDGHVCDDEDEDSDTDDGDSETDGEHATDEDSEDESRFCYSHRHGRSGDSRENITSDRRRARTETRRSARANGDMAEIDYRRKEELASVLRRLRAAIRRMDGVLTEEEVLQRSSSGVPLVLFAKQRRLSTRIFAPLVVGVFLPPYGAVLCVSSGCFMLYFLPFVVCVLDMAVAICLVLPR